MVRKNKQVNPMLYKIELQTPELDIKCVEGLLTVQHNDAVQKLITQGADIFLTIKLKVHSYRVSQASKPTTAEITVTGTDPTVEIRL